MRIIRAFIDYTPCFSQESMDKGVSGGAVSIKQWHGAFVVTLFALKIDLRVLPTGGVPTWPSRVDMYQYQGRFVANEVEKRSSPRTLQCLIEGVSRFSTIDYVSKGMSVMPAILKEFTESTIGNYG